MVKPKRGLTHVLKPCGAWVPASLGGWTHELSGHHDPPSDPSSVPMGPCLLQGGIQVSRGRKGPLTPYSPTLLQLQSEPLCSYLFPVENFHVRFCLNKASLYYKHFANLRSISSYKKKSRHFLSSGRFVEFWSGRSVRAHATHPTHSGSVPPSGKHSWTGKN